MDNKEIFAVAGLVTRALISSKIISGKARDVKQAVFEAIQPALELIEAAPKMLDEEKPDLAQMLADDPVYAKSWLINSLAKSMSEKGGAPAAKELRDILNIASRSDELQIEVVDYVNAIIDCPHCNRNVHEFVIDTESK